MTTFRTSAQLKQQLKKPLGKTQFLSSDPNLDKIGAALQSSNLYAAQHFGLELQSRGVQLQNNPSVQPMTTVIKAPPLLNEQNGTTRVDLCA